MSETYFFWMWWIRQSEEKKQKVFKQWREVQDSLPVQYQTPPMYLQVREFVSQGRLEFVGGGWSMNDEASVHYTGIIDNMGTGIAELKRLFGE